MARERAALGFGYLVEAQVIAMQAAWIEWKHGRGADEGMEWIENTLDGPGLIPDEDAGTDAQAFFDRAIKDSRERQRAAEKALDEAEASDG